jgi:hypothetical protein
MGFRAGFSLGQGAGELRGQAVAHEWLMLKAKAFGSFSVSVVE